MSAPRSTIRRQKIVSMPCADRGTLIEGVSVRLAEIIAGAWGKYAGTNPYHRQRRQDDHGTGRMP